jgi:hypothetical protein
MAWWRPVVICIIDHHNDSAVRRRLLSDPPDNGQARHRPAGALLRTIFHNTSPALCAWLAIYCALGALAGGTSARATTPSIIYHIDNNVDLQNLTSPSTYPVIVRDSFATPNDGGQAT